LDFSPGISYFFGQLGKAFFAPGSHASLLSLVGAFLIAFAFLIFRRYRKGRRIRVKALLRALFPRYIVGSKSTLADLGYFYFNIFLFGLVFGWALLSYEVVSHSVAQGLTAAFGPRQPTALPPYVYRTAITILLFLAYELGYWLNHYLSHRIPFLWEFHKVHHSATVLTPLTNFICASSSISWRCSSAPRTAPATTFSGKRRINTFCRKTTSFWCSSSIFMCICSTRGSGSHSRAGSAICS
jgi:hypothetical protein